MKGMYLGRTVWNKYIMRLVRLIIGVFKPTPGAEG